MGNKSNCKIISFINMKGGVGKTTLTINVGEQLAKKGHKVLIIDMDPQFNSTQSLLLHKVAFEDGDSLDSLKDEETIKLEDKSSKLYERLESKGLTAYSLFSKVSFSKEPSNLICTIDDNLDLIAGNLNLSNEVSGDTVNKGSLIISHIEEYNLDETYNFILIDCPPTWSILTFASLFASDGYIIPSKVDFYSSLGITMLEEKIKTHLLEDYNFKARTKTRKFTNYGIAFTLVHKSVAAEQTRIKNLKKIDTIRNNKIHIFNTEIPHMPSVPSHFNLYSDSGTNANYEKLRNAIEKLTTEILERVK